MRARTLLPLRSLLLLMCVRFFLIQLLIRARPCVCRCALLRSGDTRQQTASTSPLSLPFCLPLLRHSPCSTAYRSSLASSNLISSLSRFAPPILPLPLSNTHCSTHLSLSLAFRCFCPTMNINFPPSPSHSLRLCNKYLK